jgi:hypothetical protein
VALLLKVISRLPALLSLPFICTFNNSELLVLNEVSKCKLPVEVFSEV